MPFAQVLLFGFVISTEIRNVPIAFYYAGHDEETARLTNKILASGYFTAADNLDDVHQIASVFRKGKVKSVVLFGPDFARRLHDGDADIQIVSDASDANTASLITNYMMSIIEDYGRQVGAKDFSPLQPVIQPEVKMMYNPNMKSAFMFVPGIICLLLMLISAIMTSISIAREKELGTMEVLLASPLRPVQIITGKVIPYVIVSFAIGIIILTMGYTVFGMPFNSKLPLLLAEFLLFIILALSLGILISTITSSQQVALMISMFALLLPVLLLSGFIFPIENMPALFMWGLYIIFTSGCRDGCCRGKACLAPT
jgi:ABC-2 type transport system permease protein